MSTDGVENLFEQLIYQRPQPIFDLEIYQYQCLLNNHNESDPNTLKIKYLSTFDHWIHRTQRNKIFGLSAFNYKDFCVGVTSFIDDLYIQHGNKICYLAGDYSYHWRLNKGKKLQSYKELIAGDHFIISAPFWSYGDSHPQTSEILNYCDTHNISVHIDSAWYGCVREFNFDYNRNCIKSVGFSLSKGLSSGHNRIGIRYSKNRENGPITIANDFNMTIVNLMWLGIKLMEKYSCDYLQNKYSVAYSNLCSRLGLTETKAIHMALGVEPGGKVKVPVGVGHILKNIMK